MDQEIIKWIRETVESVRVSIIDRYEAGTVRKKDQFTLTEMLANIQEVIEKEPDSNMSIEDLNQELGKLQVSLTGDLKDNIEEVKVVTESVAFKVGELDKINHIANALQLDAQSIIPLMEQLRQKQEEVRQSFQQAVDIDYKLYGEVSDLTIQALDTFHFIVSDERQVIALTEIQVEKDKTVPIEENKDNGTQMEMKEEQDAPKEDVQPQQQEEREYLHFLPMGREQFNKTVAFLKKQGARFDGKDWYMIKGNIPWNELAAYHIEPAVEKREYLHIPAQGKAQFERTIAFLKENGARFDTKLKKWYIFPEIDGNKAKEYLNQKDSILGKLSRNKENKGAPQIRASSKEKSMER